MTSPTYPPRADSSETRDQWLDRMRDYWFRLYKWKKDTHSKPYTAPKIFVDDPYSDNGYQFKRKVDMVGRSKRKCKHLNRTFHFGCMTMPDGTPYFSFTSCLDCSWRYTHNIKKATERLNRILAKPPSAHELLSTVKDGVG